MSLALLCSVLKDWKQKRGRRKGVRGDNFLEFDLFIKRLYKVHSY